MKVKDFKQLQEGYIRYEYYHKTNFYMRQPATAFDDYIIISMDIYKDFDDVIVVALTVEKN